MKCAHKIFACLSLCLGLTVFHNAWADTNSNFPPDIAAIQKRGALRLAVYNIDLQINSSSQTYNDNVEIALGNLIASQLGVKLQVVPASSYNDVINKIAAQQVDMGEELAILPDRAMRVNFTDPYYSYHPHFLVNRLQAAKYGWNAESDILQGMQQGVEPIKIGVLQNSASVNVVQANFPKAQLIPYADPEQSLRDVVSGKIFAAMGSSPSDINTFLNNNSRANIQAQQVNLTSATLLVAIAVPWQDFHLREWLNSYLTYLKKNGITNEIFAQYGYSIE